MLRRQATRFRLGARRRPCVIPRPAGVARAAHPADIPKYVDFTANFDDPDGAFGLPSAIPTCCDGQQVCVAWPPPSAAQPGDISDALIFMLETGKADDSASTSDELQGPISRRAGSHPERARTPLKLPTAPARKITVQARAHFERWSGQSPSRPDLPYHSQSSLIDALPIAPRSLEGLRPALLSVGIACASSFGTYRTSTR